MDGRISHGVVLGYFLPFFLSLGFCPSMSFPVDTDGNMIDNEDIFFHVYRDDGETNLLKSKWDHH